MNVLTVFLGDMISYYFSVQWFKLKKLHILIWPKLILVLCPHHDISGISVANCNNIVTLLSRLTTDITIIIVILGFPYRVSLCIRIVISDVPHKLAIYWSCVIFYVLPLQGQL